MVKGSSGTFLDPSKYNVIIQPITEDIADKSIDYNPDPMAMEVDDSGFLDKSNQETPKQQHGMFGI